MHFAVRLFPGILLLCGAVEVSAALLASPGELEFPIGYVGISSAPRFVTLSNTGGTTLNVAVSASGGAFARAGGSCGAAPFNISANASCTLGYTFTPFFVGLSSQVLRATPNVGSFVDFRLIGEGEEPGLRAEPSQLIFPVQAIGQVTGPRDMTLRNTGNTSLTVVTLTPASGVYARVGGTCGAVPITIAGQASCTLSYTFTPVGIGAVYQTLRATPSVGAFDEFTLAGEAASGRLRVQPSNMDFFQPIPVGTISEEKIATLSNEGAAQLQVLSIAPAVAPPVVSFVRTGGNCPEPPFTINAFGSCQILYRFVPVVIGEVQLDMRFHNTASSPESMNLRGVGLPGDPVFAYGFEGN